MPEATARAGGSDPVYGARLQYLDWNTLVQSRASSLVSRLIIWVALGAIIVIGPMAVLAAPRLFASFDSVRERVNSLTKRNRPPPRRGRPEYSDD